MDKGNTISTREKLGALLKRFLRLMQEQKNSVFEIGWLLSEGTKIFKDSRKALDIMCYFEALGLLLRLSYEHAVYAGFKGIAHRLIEFETAQISTLQIHDQVILYGKPTSIRCQALAGLLFANIFFGMIYPKDSTSKSTIEETVEAFLHQQKELNLKNFIPEILNILGIMGLIEKNEATEVVTYIGPDLRCYDDSHRKIPSKLYELLQREQIMLGKDSNEPQIQPYPSHLPSSESTLKVAHISYFPELCYGLLRSNDWEKPIINTVFFIGRSERRHLQSTSRPKGYHVDLEISHRSVSRQHAVILFNFEAQRWEIRCLSRKNLVRVNEERLAWGDKNVWLKNKAEIQIGPEKMKFLEVNIPSE